MLEIMARGISAGALDWTRVEIPFEDNSFPGTFIPGVGTGPRPTILFCNGLDSTKEMIALAVRAAFANRGISVLAIDQPGTGEALRLRGLHAIPQCERWAASALDYLSGLKGVDASRFGIVGWSLGGFLRLVPHATRSDLSYASLGARIITGGKFNAGGLRGKGRIPFRTIGIT